MTIHKIRLPEGEWEFDDEKPLGHPGGFGEVFLGNGPATAVAVKRLKLDASQAAHRELRIGEHLKAQGLAHVVPIFDAGQDAESDRYFLIMPVCERSLQEEIDGTGKGLEVSAALEVILAILSGLKELPELVHRDLKPGNVLLHDSVWKIADFGIARFVQKSTSLETLRDCLSPAYAAPEQWNGERSTPATDIYAVGCIAHALAVGRPPFVGSNEEIREQHLNSTPPTLDCLPPRAAALISHMLRKQPAARPPLARCAEVFGNIEIGREFVPEGRLALQRAGAQVAEQEAKKEAEKRKTEALRLEREMLKEEAYKNLIEIRLRLFDEILKNAEGVRQYDEAVSFGHGGLKFTIEFESVDRTISSSKRVYSLPSTSTHDWDIIGGASIEVTRRRTPDLSAYTWSATLVYADRRVGEGYRWYEIAFFSMSPSDRSPPFAVDCYSKDFISTIHLSYHDINVAYGPLPIDGEDQGHFINRWLDLFAKAATGGLEQPRMMPISM